MQDTDGVDDQQSSLEQGPQRQRHRFIGPAPTESGWNEVGLQAPDRKGSHAPVVKRAVRLVSSSRVSQEVRTSDRTVPVPGFGFGGDDVLGDKLG